MIHLNNTIAIGYNIYRRNRMELYQLEYLVAIYEHKTILKASEQLHVSQPSITKAIKKLEDELGFPLFERNKNRLIINEEGMVAVEHAQKVLKEMKSLRKAVEQSYQKNMVITIASNAPAPLWGLKSIIPAQVNDVLIDDNEEILSRFYQNEFTIIILDYPIHNKDFVCRKLFEEQLHIAVKENHELSNRKEVSFEDINGYVFLQLSAVGYWNEVHRSNMPLSKFILQDNLDNYHLLLESSDLPVFRTNLSIPSNKKKEKRVYIPIMDPEATLSFYAIYHKRNKDILDPILDKVNTIDWKNCQPKEKKSL